MRVALTGAASGIGADVAAKMKAAGHEIVAFDITEPAGVDQWIKTDMSDFASIDAAIASAGGTFDALINNAGLPPREQDFNETMIRVNYFGLRRFLDGMLDKLNPGASIVNTASKAGARWAQHLDQVKAFMALDPADLPAFIKDQDLDPTRAYNLSKEAVVVMTFQRTEEMIARDLRMNSVSPAAVSTGILDDFINAFGDRVKGQLAKVGRAGLPEEVASTIVFLASPESNWLKGLDLHVDGGMSALSIVDAHDLA